MSDIRKLLDIINETTVAGSVATVAAPMGEMQKRVEETATEETKNPEVIEYGMWENSALATTSKLKKNRGKSAKVVKSIYGEDVQAEAANPKQQAAIAIAKKKEVAEGKFTINAKTGAKLDPRTGAELPPKEKPLTMKDMFRQPKSTAPKLSLDDVWMKIQSVVSNIYPDGDPIDYLAPWLEKHGIRDFKIGEILDRAAKKNGYKDLYDYYDSMKDQYARDNVAEGSYEETEETAVINMFEKLVKQGRDPIDMIAHKFGWGSYELDQLARNLGFKNSAGWALAVKQGKGVNEGVAEGSEDRKTAPGWHSDSVKNPNFNDELSGRRVSPPGKRLKSGKLSADERGSQERTKALMKFKKAQGGLTGPKGVLPEQDMAEGTLEESDLILNPASLSKLSRDLVSHEQDRTDHEVEMAKSDLYQAGKNAVRVFELIKDISEEEGLEGWVQEKIIKANDYLNTIREYLEGKQMESMDGVAPGTKMFTSEEKPGLWANIHAKRKRIKSGSGERMRKPGSKGAPSAQDFKDAAK